MWKGWAYFLQARKRNQFCAFKHKYINVLKEFNGMGKSNKN